MGSVWRVKRDGTCSRCGTLLRTGEVAVWERRTRSIRCVECPTTPRPEADPVQPLIEPGVAGGSARREFARREAKRDAAITERWGSGVVSRVVRTMSTTPTTTRAWARGAAGEEQLAAVLSEVPGIRVLNDRRVPGSPANIDHLVVAPAGVFVVDAKNLTGLLAIRDRGSFFRTDLRLTIGGRDQSRLADAMTWQVEAVRDALARSGVSPMPPITPVLCFLAVEWPILRRPNSFGGVRLESPGSLKRLVTAEVILSDDSIEAIARRLSAALPPK